MNLEKYSHLAFFNGLDIHAIQFLEPFFAPQTWVAGTTVFEQGDYAEHLYLVVNGEVAIRYKPEDGAIMTITRVQPGGIFGWSAAMGNPTYTSSAVCTLDSEILRIRGNELRSLCDKHPELGTVILNRLAGVIAERKQSKQQGQLKTILANGMGKASKN